MDINININVGEEPKVEVKKDKPKVKKRKLKNGKETIIELPNTTETLDKRGTILDMMGV